MLWYDVVVETVCMVVQSVISVIYAAACDCGDTQITGSTPVIIDGTQTNTVVPDT